MNRPKIFTAFTLAEVLITLGIIGVVAALTMPALIAKYDEMVIVNKLKRSYSEIANAIELRKSELGTSDYAEQFNPNLSSTEQLEGFAKYLNVVEKCSSTSNRNGCGGIYRVKPQKKTNDGFGNVSTGGNIDYDRVLLSDGTLIWFGKRNWSGDCEVQYEKHETDAWTIESDYELFDILEDLDRKGIKWGMSNVFVNKGNVNEHLIKWCEENNWYV